MARRGVARRGVADEAERRAARGVPGWRRPQVRRPPFCVRECRARSLSRLPSRGRGGGGGGSRAAPSRFPTWSPGRSRDSGTRAGWGRGLELRGAVQVAPSRPAAPD